MTEDHGLEGLIVVTGCVICLIALRLQFYASRGAYGREVISSEGHYASGRGVLEWRRLWIWLLLVHYGLNEGGGEAALPR